MGVAGFVLGTLAGQFAGAWVYWRIRGNSPPPANREYDAAMAAGFVTTIVASAIYVPLGVHTWLSAMALRGACRSSSGCAWVSAKGWCFAAGPWALDHLSQLKRDPLGGVDQQSASYLRL